MMRSRRRGLSALFLFSLIGGCSTPPPLREYTLARTALLAAKEAESPRYAPSFWQEAEEQYRQGEVAFQRNEQAEALERFETSRKFSERAENSARLQKHRSGEIP